METTEYDLYDLLIGDDDISAIGDGSVTGAISSLSTSITNLIQVQYVSTASASCNSLASITMSATVTACPEDYSWLFVPIGSYRSLTRVTGLSGTTITFDVTNISSSTQNVGAVGRLIYYPSTWDI